MNQSINHFYHHLSVQLTTLFSLQKAQDKSLGSRSQNIGTSSIRCACAAPSDSLCFNHVTPLEGQCNRPPSLAAPQVHIASAAVILMSFFFFDSSLLSLVLATRQMYATKTTILCAKSYNYLKCPDSAALTSTRARHLTCALLEQAMPPPLAPYYHT